MSEPRTTPGPWRAVVSLDSWVIVDDHERYLGEVTAGVDAHVMAAAPELLRGCRIAREFLIEEYTGKAPVAHIVAGLADAIAKASPS